MEKIFFHFHLLLPSPTHEMLKVNIIFSQQFKFKYGPHWSMLLRMEKCWCDSDGG